MSRVNGYMAGIYFPVEKGISWKNPRQSGGSENRAFISSVSAAMLAHCSEVVLFQMQQRMFFQKLAL